MKKRLLVLLLSLASLTLVSCGGGNDVASSGATAVSAAAPVTTTTATAPSTAATEAKVNGQVDERTGVAPVVAQMTPWSPTANGGCGNSLSVNLFANPAGPNLTNAQVGACLTAAFAAQTLAQCNALGGSFSPQPYSNFGSCTVQNGPDYYNPVPSPPIY